MKNLCQLLLIAFFLFTAKNQAFAQTGYAVSGQVINEKGEPLKSATVFIAGSERIMPTDENGRFNFAGIPAGNFQLSVQMLGFSSYTQSLVVKGGVANINIQLKVKPIDLQQVNIGRKNASKKNLKLFTDMFLGQSRNAKECVILNPEIINFSTKKGQLLADADDFLIIENKRLGYRLHYLLKGFDYSHNIGVVLYHGDCTFEELDGTDAQKKQWAKNRLAAYKGSFMHFLRAVHDNNTLENGFMIRPVLGYGTFTIEGDSTQILDRIITKEKQVVLDSLLTAVDTNFTSLKFRQPLFVTYDPKTAAQFMDHQADVKEGINLGATGSVLKLVTDKAVIDKKGSYTDYRDFYIQGYWASTRVGDELPVDYQPPAPQIHPRKTIHSNPLLTSLQKWTDSIPQEKAYLHLDKPYYAAGDTMWFKGYLTTGSRHKLSPLSGAVYIDLVNEQNKAIKTLKLPLDSGTVGGDLILDDSVATGSYRIRAYTQWMRNAGEDYFFDHAFTVGKPLIVQNKKVIKPDLQQTDVQFFPESGNLINGITSRVGFKAVGTDGLGEAISGTVTDNANNQVAQFSTLYAGMGSFSLKPQPGQTYTANIKFADGSTKALTLPAALNEGYTLNVYQPNKDSVLVRIQASPGLQHSKINLIAQSSGEVLYSAQLDLTGPMTSIWLDKISFPSGIAQFTLFDDKNQPLNERIVFIKAHDNMQLTVKTSQAKYKSREHVQLELNATESGGTPVGANFSVAVTDETKVPVDESAESTIFSNILLKSDIKGYIEKPNYYFLADTDEVNKALDNLMLTQGYRRFEWKHLDSTVNTKPTFKAEGLTTSISGLVTDLQNHILPNANVLLLSMNARINRTTTTDANGRFKFDSLAFVDSAKFAVQARTKENSTHAILILDSIPKARVTVRQNFADINIIKTNLKKAEDEGTPAKLTGLHVLKEVDIKAAQLKKEDKTVVPQGMFSLPDEASADHIYTIPDPEHYVDLMMFIQERVAGVRVETDKFGKSNLVSVRPPTNQVSNVYQAPDNVIEIIVDGVMSGSDIGSLGNMQLDDIAKIEVVNHNQASMNFLRINNGAPPPAGYILILTKPASERHKHYDPNIANIMPKGYNAVRQFYSPRYDKPNDAANKPDNRTTIYWNPYINTNLKGKATFDFYNADGPGNYRVVVEGINSAGELGRQVYHYRVE